MKGILTAFIISAGVCLMVFGSVPTEPPQELQAAAPVQEVSLAEFRALQDEVAALKKQVADFKSCQCEAVAKAEPTPAETFTKPIDEPPVAKQEHSVLAEPYKLAPGYSWTKPTSGSYTEYTYQGRPWYKIHSSVPVYGGNCANGNCNAVRGWRVR